MRGHMMREQFQNKVSEEFPQKRVIVIGDLMVDEYIIGKVKRISPEAPVPVLNYKQSKREAGGASNVAHNLKNLGARTAIVGVVGNDNTGKWLRKHLQEKGIEVEGIFFEENRPTSVKTRFATKGQQLFRVDNESTYSILHDTHEKIISYLSNELEDCDAVILSDYKKGVLNNEVFVKKLIHMCNEKSVLIAVDSKSRNIEMFENADFVKPNNLELEEAVNIKITDIESLDRAGKVYLETSKAKALIVTRGAAGISVFLPQKDRQDYVAEEAQVFDVTGAGDTVISTIALGMTSGLSIGEAVKLANYAASVVISKVGTSAVTAQELLERINEK